MISQTSVSEFKLVFYVIQRITEGHKSIYQSQDVKMYIFKVIFNFNLQSQNTFKTSLLNEFYVGSNLIYISL